MHLHPPDSFWKWQEDGAWRRLERRHDDHVTVPELGLDAEPLAPAGLPPLGSVLLLIAACRRQLGRSRPPAQQYLRYHVLRGSIRRGITRTCLRGSRRAETAFISAADLGRQPAAKVELAAMSSTARRPADRPAPRPSARIAHGSG